MQMGMMKQILSPTMEYGEEADFGAQMLGIGGDGGQGLGGGAEQNAVDHLLVLVGDGGDLFGQGKDDMEILRVEKFGGSILDPLRARQRLAFWAMSIRRSSRSKAARDRSGRTVRDGRRERRCGTPRSRS